MNRNELALSVASHWTEVLGGHLTGKRISISFEASGYFPDDWTTALWKLPYRTRETLPKAVAHLLRDGKRIPEKEVPEAVLRDTFDCIEITIFQVPERENIPKWVEEEYFVRGILRALLQIRYPDWDKDQLIDYEKKLLGEKDRKTKTTLILRIPLYICALVLIVLSINFTIFWALGYITEDMTNMYIALAIEGMFVAGYGLTFTRVFDIEIYGPTVKFYGIVRYPQRLAAAVTFIASGILLFLIALFSLS